MPSIIWSGKIPTTTPLSPADTAVLLNRAVRSIVAVPQRDDAQVFVNAARVDVIYPYTYPEETT